MMRFSCILFTIYFCRCKLYRSRSKALYGGLFRAIPNYTPLRQAEMPQIRVAAVSRVNIRLGYDRLVCPKRSSLWQSIGGDSRMRPLSNSAECPDVMDPERGSVSSGAVVALYRTVACRVPVWKYRAGRVQLRGRLVPLSSYQVRSGEIQVQRSSAEPGLFGAIRGLQVLSGSCGSCRPLPRSCARCSPLYWLLSAKTQLPPYGGLREFELKCLRSHPTLLRFYPQALSGAPVLS